MYSDPAKIRDNPVRLRFSDYEKELVEAFVEKNGGHRAALLRELIMDRVLAELRAESTPKRRISEAPQQVLGW